MSSIVNKEEMNDLMQSDDHKENINSSSDQLISYDLLDQAAKIKDKSEIFSKANESFCGVFKELLSSFINQSISISSEGLQIIKYSEYISTLEEYSIISQLEADQQVGSILCVVDPLLLNIITDLYFGGGAQFVKPCLKKQLSEIDNKILASLMQLIIESLQQGWQSEAKLNCQFIERTFALENPCYAEDLEYLLISRFNIKLKENECSLHVVYPSRTIYAIHELKKFAGEDKQKKTVNENWRNTLMKNIQSVDIEVGCVLVQQELPLGIVRKIKKEAIIPITLPEVVNIQTDGCILFEGKFGVLDEQYAVQINRRTNKE